MDMIEILYNVDWIKLAYERLCFGRCAPAVSRVVASGWYWNVVLELTAQFQTRPVASQ